MNSEICECGCEIKYWGEKSPHYHKCFKCGNKVEFKEEEIIKEVTPESRPPLKKRGRPAGVKRKA